MPVRLGISPIGWSNDDLPELGGDTLLDTWATFGETPSTTLRRTPGVPLIGP
jgi:hypothetical protein